MSHGQHFAPYTGDYGEQLEAAIRVFAGRGRHKTRIPDVVRGPALLIEQLADEFRPRSE